MAAPPVLPAWTRAPEHTTLEATWPGDNRDQRKAFLQNDYRVEVGFFTTTNITAVAKAKFGNNAAVQGKMLSARVHKNTQKVIIYYDRFLANAAKTEVTKFSLVKEFSLMEKDCPRALRKFAALDPNTYQFHHGTFHFDPMSCKKTSDDTDDYEDEPLIGGGIGGLDFDRWDGEILDAAHEYDMDESGIRVKWNEQYDPDANAV